MLVSLAVEGVNAMGVVTEQAGDFALKDAAAAAQAFGSTANFTIRSTRSRDVRVLRIKDR